jgi:hypothetical protein
MDSDAPSQSVESPYAFVNPSSVSTPISEIETKDSPVNVASDISFATLAASLGFSDLRSPTARGNVLVLGSIINPESLRAELAVRETRGVRSRTILQLIDNDAELTPRSKETVHKLMPLYCRSDYLNCPLFLGFLFAAVGGVLFVMGDGQSSALSGSRIALVVIGSVLMIIYVIQEVLRCKEVGRLEKELEDACGGSILMHPVLA